jgi:hypothetical protein
VKRRGHLENLDVDERIILKYIGQIGSWDVDCINRLQDGHKWLAFVNAAVNL